MTLQITYILFICSITLLVLTLFFFLFNFVLILLSCKNELYSIFFCVVSTVKMLHKNYFYYTWELLLYYIIIKTHVYYFFVILVLVLMYFILYLNKLSLYGFYFYTKLNKRLWLSLDLNNKSKYFFIIWFLFLLYIIANN